MELLRQALTELAAAKEREYLDEEADREAIATRRSSSGKGTGTR